MNVKKIPKLYLIGIPILLALIGLIIFTVYLPLTNKIKSEKAVLTAKREELKKVRQSVKTLMKLKQQSDVIKAKIEKLEAMIPPNQDVSGLINLLEQLEEESGIKIKKVDFPTVAEKESLSSVTGISKKSCLLTITGTYAQTISFIDALKQASRLLGVEQIKYLPTDYGQNLDLDLKLVYFYRSAAGETKPDTTNTGNTTPNQVR